MSPGVRFFHTPVSSEVVQGGDSSMVSERNLQESDSSTPRVLTWEVPAPRGAILPPPPTGAPTGSSGPYGAVCDRGRSWCRRGRFFHAPSGAVPKGAILPRPFWKLIWAYFFMQNTWKSCIFHQCPKGAILPCVLFPYLPPASRFFLPPTTGHHAQSRQGGRFFRPKSATFGAQKWILPKKKEEPNTVRRQ